MSSWTGMLSTTASRSPASATHAIHDLHHMPVGSDDCARRAVEEHGAPGVLAGPQDLPLRDGDRAAAEPVRERRRERIAVCFDAEHGAHGLAVADQDISLAREGLDE